MRINGLALAVALVGAAVTIHVSARPAAAQFEEPDTIPRFGVGPVLELTFRGSRGTAVAEQTVGVANGPGFGARIEYRLNPTAAVGLMGTYARTSEERETSGGDVVTDQQGMTFIQVSGELLMKVKASVPGFFIIGGGVRFVDPDVDDPDTGFTQNERFTEALLTAGLGLEFLLSRKNTFRIAGRLYPSLLTEQPDFVETKSIGVDFALGFVYLRRF